MKKFSLLLAIMTLISCGTSKTTKQPANPIDYANTITSEELKDMLYVYASDEFEGRETGEPGQKKAVDFLKKQYQAMQITSPLGGDNYFQKVDLVKSYTP